MSTIAWLSGVKVLLLGHYVPGPFAAYLLRNLGAEVIKVEDRNGDHLRQLGSYTTANGHHSSPMFGVLNAGFQSLGLAYRKPDGAKILRELISHVDIVIDGQRAGTLERHLDVSLSVIAPHLIYVPITAYGLVGPMAALAGHDNNVLGIAGNLSYTQTDANGLPTVFSAPVADLFAGQMAAMGALAALFGRRQAASSPTALQTIDASMLHAGFFLNVLELADRNAQGYRQAEPGTAWMNGGRANYRSYRCSDGKLIFFGMLEESGALRFFKGIDRLDLAPNFKDDSILGPALVLLFAARSQAEWVAFGALHDACITPVNDLETAIQEPQVRALGRMQNVDIEGVGKVAVPSFPLGFGPESSPIASYANAPTLGQHNEEILTSLLQLNSEAIATLYEAEVLIRAATVS